MRYEIQTNSKSKIKSMCVTFNNVSTYTVYDNLWLFRCLNASSQLWISKNILSRRDLNTFPLKTVDTTPAIHKKLV